ncbi:GntR family transcriptional regulator [Shinella sp. 838]|uniref:GntR family transcriptional regulator n=1 Tax=Shinella sp. 838 TaxID=3038164 RepID=UPI0024158DE5|nr:GntR family transcriptional regulator [Shinella sp. 838]MDG4674921.1 GntR family transcriptional regulator [Shinella sp. 838]
MSLEVSERAQQETLFEAVLDDIFSGHLVGGQRLKISELAKRFGVSASPVREALRKMEGEGFVEIHPNRGAIVKQADAKTLQNIFEVLQLLEPYFVKWFAEYAQPEMIDEIAEIQEALRREGGQDLTAFRRLDTEFHGKIVSYHYNYVAADSWRKLRRALNVHASPFRIGPVRLRTIIEEHDALIAALRRNDAQEADRVIRKHVEGSFVQMSQQMRALGIRGIDRSPEPA